MEMTTTLPPPTNRELLNRFVRRIGICSWIEALHPIVFGIGAGVSFHWVSLTDVQVSNINEDVLPLAVSVAAILAGFQGAMHAIFLAVIGSRTVLFLRKKNAYKSLMRYIRSGVISLVVFVAMAMMVIVLSALSLLPDWPRTVYGFLVGLFTYSLLATTRIMLILLRLLDHADNADLKK
jgi:hypothetical protein